VVSGTWDYCSGIAHATHFMQVPRYTHPDHQRPYGYALALAASAEGLLLHVAELYMEYGQRWAQTGQPFSREDDIRLYAMLQQAGQFAAKAVEVIWAAAGSPAAKRGQRLQRYYRDVSMYHGHIAAQYLNTAGELARVHSACRTPFSRRTTCS
jgi:3-hydroxy-9,10-secoandrosta-1,3,5(10)-triene-9,17-dione monooxygenase